MSFNRLSIFQTRQRTAKSTKVSQIRCRMITQRCQLSVSLHHAHTVDSLHREKTFNRTDKGDRTECTPSLISCKLSSMVVVFTALTIYERLAGSFWPAWVSKQMKTCVSTDPRMSWRRKPARCTPSPEY